MIKELKIFCEYLKKVNFNNQNNEPVYQIIEIAEEDEEYTVTVRIRHKNITFYTKPEEILADDSLVDRFSPRDIRALTYLGYLGINRPKYKILAQKLSQNEKTTVFLKKRGEKKIIVKTAAQIIQETDMIIGMNSEDAKTVGYLVAQDDFVDEKKQKEALLKELKI